nr:AAA family ATPase [Pedobacter sp. ASV19]
MCIRDSTSTAKWLTVCTVLKEVLKTEEEILASRIHLISQQLSTLETDRNKARHQLNQLEDSEYCVQQKIAVGSMIEKLEEIFKLQKAQSQFSAQKTKLSKDKGRVEEELIRKNYLLSFNKHLADFGFKRKEKISRPFSTPAGTSKIDGRIEGAIGSFEVNAILSEGEAKVYSLCDWLTELEFDDSEILIFDDPITSLDQVNIDKVVDKIVSLSSRYQTVVFTHNLEFYHRLVQQSLGGGQLHKAKCEICDAENEKNQCGGFVAATGNTHKCCTYYQIEYILQPGKVIRDVMFLSLNWEQRIALLRKNLLAGDIKEADKHLRTSINNFFERFVLADIKRSVYKNNDLIKEYRGFREIDLQDYDALMEVHNKVSAEGTLHEPSAEVRTPLDVQGYITEFNKAAVAINNMYNKDSSSKPKNVIELIEIL